MHLTDRADLDEQRPIVTLVPIYPNTFFACVRTSSVQSPKKSRLRRGMKDSFDLFNGGNFRRLRRATTTYLPLMGVGVRKE